MPGGMVLYCVTPNGECCQTNVPTPTQFLVYAEGGVSYSINHLQYADTHAVVLARGNERVVNLHPARYFSNGHAAERVPSGVQVSFAAMAYPEPSHGPFGFCEIASTSFVRVVGYFNIVESLLPRGSRVVNRDISFAVENECLLRNGIFRLCRRFVRNAGNKPRSLVILQGY